ncbi:hypothetical protein NXS19_009444 [Fusarium pseudograminearum]|nr:hypothetical protein NXS19_009444 [Fusarium pseudograminearum]
MLPSQASQQDREIAERINNGTTQLNGLSTAVLGRPSNYATPLLSNMSTNIIYQIWTLGPLSLITEAFVFGYFGLVVLRGKSIATDIFTNAGIPNPGLSLSFQRAVARVSGGKILQSTSIGDYKGWKSIRKAVLVTAQLQKNTSKATCILRHILSQSLLLS